MQRPTRLTLLLLIGCLALPAVSAAQPQPLYRPTPQAKLVINAGLRQGIVAIVTGRMEPICQQAAEAHANYMARVQVQGHQEWEQRYHELRRKLPEYADFVEVAAESWSWQSEAEAAPEMFKSWRQSPGHWQAISTPCAGWGFAMARGRNGIFYGCGIMARRTR